MSYHLDSHTSNSSSRLAQQPLLQAGEAVAPALNLQTTAARRNDRLFSTGNRSIPHSGHHFNSNSSSPYVGSDSTSSLFSSTHQTPYHSPALNLQAEETTHRSPTTPKMASQRGAIFPKEFTPSSSRIHSEQQSPENSPYQSAGQQQIPGSLQPGRPGLMTANTISSNSSNSQALSHEHYSTPLRTTAPGFSQYYTRSSPAGYDSQAYAPFTPTTSNGNDHTSPTSHKYAPQNSQRNLTNAPLGLADIRPRAHSGVSDGFVGANPYSFDGTSSAPKNSNYIAPWAVYAFDWCKWPTQGHDAGKVALGSYLEDGHNYVSFLAIIYF